uniref:Reverse transcriptase domain-containing protein n=1 Tax=Tanacetum cinerariifolium TaxID=118510 RepID=A0A6L2NEX6_TANCI|nr:reverse transcriptase domain-containing protein [Tanacetum cinerariifolium]
MADDQPMWGNNQAVAPTPGATIVVVDLGYNFTNVSIWRHQRGCHQTQTFPPSVAGEAKIWFNELSLGVITTWEEMRQAFVSRFFPPAMFDRLMGEIRGFTQQHHESLVDAWLQIKGDVKEMRNGCNKCGGPHPSSNCNDKPVRGPKEEEANYASRGYRGGYRGNYYGRNSSNWRDRHENRSLTLSEENSPIPRLPEKRPDESEFEKTMREFVIAQKTSNEFVKNQFNNLKTKVKQGQKNHQDAIQDLETKFGRIFDHQSSRPPGTLHNNTQTNPKPSTSNERPYLPLSARNEHVNVVFTRSGKTYNPPANLNTKTAIFLDDSEDETEEVKKEADLYQRNQLSRYAALSGTTLKPIRMSIRLTNHTYQYPMGVAENMLVQFGKFVFPVDFVILQMEEDDRDPLILGRSFLHTADAIIRVKNK